MVDNDFGPEFGSNYVKVAESFEDLGESCEHHDSLTVFVDAAADGCHLCTLLMAELYKKRYLLTYWHSLTSRGVPSEGFYLRIIPGDSERIRGSKISLRRRISYSTGDESICEICMDLGEESENWEKGLC
jgi:hypothetical protein